MDLAIRKLRWLLAPGRMLLQADMNRRPFRDGAFAAVVCSEVIQHVPREEVKLAEQARVLPPGGVLVLGTPDYERRLWRTLEWIYGKALPGEYVKEHINGTRSRSSGDSWTNSGLRSRTAGTSLGPR
jgi:ubiquinone/menaquinone biosynthesis C-methylase UbiE